MPFPAGLTLVAVHGRVDSLPSGGASGQVCFTRPYALVGGVDNSIVPPRPEYATLDAAGEFTISLPATNDPDWTPVNWAYSVEINTSAGLIRGTLQLSYLTASVELADLLQVDGTAVAGTTYIALSSRGVAGGVAALDADGDVNDAAGNKITGGGGGGGTPSGTVVAETGYGQAAVVGAASAYSRGDHSHGTPALGTSGTTAAAGDHTHAGVYQPLDSDLTTIAGLTATTDNTIQSVAGAWASRTPAQVKAALAVGISDVASLQAGLDAKAPLASPTFTGTVAGVTKTMVGLGNVDDTSDAGKPVSSATQTALDLKAAIASPALTGVPTAPTAAGGTNTTQLATTAFVTTAVAGGGGGSTLVVKRAVVSSGNITPQNTAGSWAALTGGPTLVIPAAVGDYIAVEIMSVLMTKDNATFYDLAVLAGASLVRFGSSGTGTPAAEGDGSFYPDTAFPRSGTVFDFVAVSGDIDGGNVTACWAVKSGGAGVLHAGFYPLRWRVLNHGAATVS